MMGINGASATNFNLTTSIGAASVNTRMADSQALGERRSNDTRLAPEQRVASVKAPESNTPTVSASVDLTDEEQALIRELKARDSKVRQHEQAHLAASGGLARGMASFSYVRGPDGVNYATGGEVNIDVSPGRTPEETIERAKTIQAAAMAPADPSGQDMAVASRARQMEMKARIEQSNADRLATNKSNEKSTRERQADNYSSVQNNQDEPDLISLFA